MRYMPHEQKPEPDILIDDLLEQERAEILQQLRERSERE
jgi:hypothetical protein